MTQMKNGSDNNNLKKKKVSLGKIVNQAIHPLSSTLSPFQCDQISGFFPNLGNLSCPLGFFFALWENLKTLKI